MSSLVSTSLVPKIIHTDHIFQSEVQSACNIKINMGQHGAKHCDEDTLIFKAIGGHIHEIWASDYRAWNAHIFPLPLGRGCLSSPFLRFGTPSKFWKRWLCCCFDQIQSLLQSLTPLARSFIPIIPSFRFHFFTPLAHDMLHKGVLYLLSPWFPFSSWFIHV